MISGAAVEWAAVSWLAAPVGWLLPVIAVASTLLVLGLAGERGLWRRGRGAARVGRIVAWVTAVVALAMLVLRPQVRGASGAPGAVLWTDGVPTTVDLEGRPGYEVPPSGAAAVAAAARTGASSPTSGAGGVEILPDARSLWRNHPGLARLEVVGHGLDAFDWEGFDGAVAFSPPKLPRGIVRAQWDRELTLGERLRIAGAVELGGATGRAGEVKLVLEGPGGVDDAAVLRPAEAPVPFRLAAVPRAAGAVVYVLRGLDPSGAELFRESIDAVVVAPRLPAVLVLESAPRFETRFLKDWLAGAGGRIAVRSTISKDRRRMEAPGVADDSGGGAGAPVAAGAVLDLASLRTFDAVVADPAALEALSAAERAALRAALEEGCGLLVTLPRAVPPPPTPMPTPPTLKTIPDLELLSARPVWPGAPSLPPLDVEARELVACPACVPLISDPSGRVLATAAPLGRATVAWSVLHDTYRYVLEGNAAAHRALWSRLLSAVARPRAAVEGRWLTPSGPILVDRPLELTLMTTESAPSAELLDSLEATSAREQAREEAAGAQRLALRQDALEPERWTATLWPRRVGLQSVRASSGATLTFVTAAAGEWSAWQAAERQEATLRRASGSAVPAPSTAGGTTAWHSLARWPFFALFLAGLGWLWIDERLRG